MNKTTTTPWRRDDDWTDTGVERRAPVKGDDFTDSDIAESVRDFRRSRRAVSNFLRAGRRKEAKTEPRGENAFQLANRIREMSDEEFDKAVAEGRLTPEQIRKAGEYDFDIYMGDVWIENPDNDTKPEPSYDEFMSDPAKYGYDTVMDYQKFSRYNPARYKK